MTNLLISVHFGFFWQDGGRFVIYPSDDINHTFVCDMLLKRGKKLAAIVA